jgi:hypothetical protein
MTIPLRPFRIFSKIRGDIRETAINPFHGFSVIAGVVDIGDKFGLFLI